jgi:hypothetical protein
MYGIRRSWDRGFGQPHDAIEIEDPIHVS